MYAKLFIRLPRAIRKLLPRPSFQALFAADEVEVGDMHIPPGGHDYWCDAYVMDAYWVRLDERLTDDEMDHLSNESDWIWAEIERQVY